jgi:hypothetical protein
VVTLSCKKEFETTDNITEYDALVLGLRVAKDMAIEKLLSLVILNRLSIK